MSPNINYMNPTTATVLQDGLSAMLDNPYKEFLSREDQFLCHINPDWKAFEATSQPIPLTQPCEPCSKVKIDLDAPVKQWADEDADYFLGWVNKPMENARTRIAYIPLKEPVSNENHIAEDGEVKSPYVHTLEDLEAIILRLENETGEFIDYDRLNSEISYYKNLIRRKNYKPSVVTPAPPSTQQGQTVEEAANKYPNRPQYNEEAETILKEMNKDRFTVKHTDCGDPIWQDGYTNGYIVGREKSDAQCNNQWVKVIEDRIKELEEFKKFRHNLRENINLKIDELSSLLKQIKGE